MAKVACTFHHVHPDDGIEKSHWMVGCRQKWYVQASSKGLVFRLMAGVGERGQVGI